jgi:hypothetical protein
MAVEGEEMVRKESGYAKKTSLEWYNYCVEIRCQDTTIEG